MSEIYKICDELYVVTVKIIMNMIVVKSMCCVFSHV